MGSRSLFQGIFPNQGLNPGLPHCRQILYQLSYQGSLSEIVCIFLISFRPHSVWAAVEMLSFLWKRKHRHRVLRHLPWGTQLPSSGTGCITSQSPVSASPPSSAASSGRQCFPPEARGQLSPRSPPEASFPALGAQVPVSTEICRTRLT